jgi:hypothetical protein
LVAVSKTSGGQRFQNYRSVFTILDLAVIERPRLRGFIAGLATRSSYAPEVWNQWVKTGEYRPLTSEPTTVIRTVAEQMPDTENKIAILRAVYQHFKDSPHQSEAFAARVFQMHDRRVIIDQITRASIDGGRDAIGRYALGLSDDPVYVDFALEAKCYSPGIGGTEANTVGVREISRLISRLRHRQFGVLVTTSAVARQGYEEVREDRHPIFSLPAETLPKSSDVKNASHRRAAAVLPRLAFHPRLIRLGAKTAAGTQPERPVLRTVYNSHVFRVALRRLRKRDELGPSNPLQWTGTHGQSGACDLSQKSSVEAHASLSTLFNSNK